MFIFHETIESKPTATVNNIWLPTKITMRFVPQVHSILKENEWVIYLNNVWIKYPFNLI